MNKNHASDSYKNIHGLVAVTKVIRCRNGFIIKLGTLKPAQRVDVTFKVVVHHQAHGKNETYFPDLI